MTRRARWPQVRHVAAATTTGAGAVHLGVATSHVADSALLGFGFVVTGVLQLLVGAALIALPHVGRARLAPAAIAVNLAAFVAWGASRTVGLPIGHPGPEALAFPDLVTVLFELTAIGAIVWWLRPSQIGELTRRTTAVAVAVWVLSLAGAGTAVAVFAIDGHGHGEHVAETRASGTGHDGSHASHDGDGLEHPHGADDHHTPGVHVPASPSEPTTQPAPATPSSPSDEHPHAPGEGH